LELRRQAHELGKTRDDYKKIKADLVKAQAEIVRLRKKENPPAALVKARKPVRKSRTKRSRR
jgi:5-bromo-4-chloroindolyl phosphate hydrolysis protein